MIALPKAISQGSKAGGGGALIALTAISAARAGADTIASAVANNTIFFMRRSPSDFKISPIRRPQGQTVTDCSQIPSTSLQSAARYLYSEAQKTRMCRLFERYRLGNACSWRVLHSDNNFGPFSTVGKDGCSFPVPFTRWQMPNHLACRERHAATPGAPFEKDAVQKLRP